jgi:hypothetical protein
LLVWPKIRLALAGRRETSGAKAHPWARDGNVWTYALVPPLFLFLGIGFSVGPFNASLQELWIPVAAWLGARHGRRGLRVVLIAGVPLLLGIRFFGFYTLGAIGSYVAAILACRLSGQPRYREEAIAAGEVTPRMLAFLFFAVAIDFGYGIDLSPLDLFVWTSFAAYFWMLLIVIGMSDARLGRLLGCLVIAAAIGFFVPYLGAQSPRVAGCSADYWISGPDAIFTAMASLLVGRLLRRRLQASPGDRGPIAGFAAAQRILAGSPFECFTSLLLLLGLSLAGSMISLEFPSFLPSPAEGFVTLSSATATALLLFACGLVGGTRGALLATALWLAACIALPLLIAPPEIPGINAGLLRINSPQVYVQTTVQIAPSMSLALLDPIFALLGCLVGKRLAARPHEAMVPVVDRSGATRPSIPPPFRFQRMDIVWAAVGALWMAGTVAYAISQIAAFATSLPTLPTGRNRTQ